MSTTDVLNPTPPSGLTDAAVLARLANEFFAALPGRSAAGGVPLTGTVTGLASVGGSLRAMNMFNR